jgi:flavodoxin I
MPIRNIGVFVGSSNGNTEEAANIICESLFQQTGLSIDLYNIKDEDVDAVLEYDVVLLGCSTWYDGQLQDNWSEKFDEFKKLKLAGKPVALFGAGDQVGYAASFQDALGILGRAARAAGGKIVGTWPTAGYTYEKSLGLDGPKFFGLALDYDNQADLNDERIAQWVTQLIGEAGLKS